MLGGAVGERRVAADSGVKLVQLVKLVKLARLVKLVKLVKLMKQAGRLVWVRG